MGGYENPNQKRGMDNLPDEILIHIFTFMSGSDFEICCMVSTRWETIIRYTPSIWQGDYTYKAIGLNERPSMFVHHLQLFKFVRYIEYSERARDGRKESTYRVLGAIKKKRRYLEVIRLRDPYIMIRHIKTLLKIPSLKELQVIFWELYRRDQRLKKLEQQFQEIELPFGFMFFNELKFTWKRSNGRTFTLQQDYGPNTR